MHSDKSRNELSRGQFSGTLDVDSLTHSQNYELLHETWIIFICDFDMFCLEELAYKVRMSLCSFEDEPLSESYEDGTHKIFLNLDACDKIKDERLRNFLKYLNICRVGKTGHHHSISGCRTARSF